MVFRLVPDGWRHRDFGASLGALLGLPASGITPGRMTYHLRRLRLHGLIERLPGTHRYRVTEPGLRLSLFFTRVHARLFRPGLAVVRPEATWDDAPPRIRQRVGGWRFHAPPPVSGTLLGRTFGERD